MSDAAKRKLAAEQKAALERRATAEQKVLADRQAELDRQKTATRPEWSAANRWRGVVKRSVAESAPGVAVSTESFPSLVALMRTLPEDGEIRVRNGIYPGPNATAHEERLDEERRNVRVTCWLYAIRHDTSDIRHQGDMELVLGSTNDATTAQFLLAEIPAYDPNQPTAGDPFEKTRRSLGILLPAYTITSEFRPMLPVSVTVEGALFFDGVRSTEPQGESGPGWARLTTVWEIHPVTTIALTR